MSKGRRGGDESQCACNSNSIYFELYQSDISCRDLEGDGSLSNNNFSEWNSVPSDHNGQMQGSTNSENDDYGEDGGDILNSRSGCDEKSANFTVQDENNDESNSSENTKISKTECNETSTNGRRGWNNFMPLPPWTTRRYIGKFEKILHKEILDLYKYLMPTVEEKILRYDLFFRTEKCIRELFPDSKVVFFGSLASDMLLPTSDIDILIEDIEPTFENFHNIADHLKSSGTAQDLQIISCTKVPIIKFSDCFSHIQVDIIVNQKSGLVNTEVVKQFAALFIPMRPLILVLKYLLQLRGMNVPFYGGMGSYTLSLLVISFLQMHEKTDKETGKTEQNLGILLCDFFLIYGFCFNYNDIGISVRETGSYFVKKERKWTDKFQPFLLSIEDPNDEMNDVGRSTSNILLIRNIFIDAYYRLTINPTVEYAPTLLSRIIQLSPLVLDHRERCTKIARKLLTNNIELIKKLEPYFDGPIECPALSSKHKHQNTKDKLMFKLQKRSRPPKNVLKMKA